MSGLLNNFYYGKAGKADFTPEQLPKNRLQLFFSMLRVRFSGMIGLNWIHILFSLPTIIWTLFNLTMLISLLPGEAEAGGVVAEATTQLSGYVIIYLLGMIPCMMLSSLSRMGLAIPLRNWARDEHAFVMSDFKDALKGNWKTALIVGFISGLSLLLTYVCFMYYGAMAVNSVLWIIPQVLVVAFCAIWWMATMLIYPMAVTYDMNFKTLVQNSIIMSLARLPMSLLCWVPITFFGVALLMIFSSTYVLLAVVLYYLVIGFALYQFLYTSYAISCFDRFLNPRIEGASVNKGLRDPAYDEEDDSVTEEDINNL